MKNSTFTAELRIKTIIDEAQKNLTSFGESFRKAWANGEPPKNLERAYENMRLRLESLKELSKKGVVDSSDLRRAEQDYQAFQKDIHNLTVEFKLMTTEQKRAMLSKEEQDAMQARAAAVKEYTAALEKNRKIAQQREPLEKERARLEAEQASRRRQAEATIADASPRLERLKSAGKPLALSKEATAYEQTLAKQLELTKKIETTQVRITSLQKQGLKEGGNNELTRTRKELELLLKEQERFESMAGKAEYETALQNYNAEVAKLEQSVSSAKEEIKSMDEAFETIDASLKKLNLKDMDTEFEALKQRLKELGVEGIDGARDIETLKKAIQQLDKEAIAKVDKEINGFIKDLGSMGTGAQSAKKGIDKATDSIQRQEEALRQREAFEGKIKQFLGLSGAAQLLRRALQDAMQTITELDATMTEMSVVTDLGVGDYWAQLPQYTERANELGLAINDVYKADTLYYQQGLKTNEVIAISTETMKMAKIAGLDTAEATDRMTAALRGFNMEMNETSAQKISDVYSELAAITAADVDEISTAMTKTASIASSAGMEFETTAAFLSQIIETTRESAETAGTAMKTVIARFQELKKAPSEIGEVDGEIVDANKIETALRSVGVSLRDSSGQFRDLDDVFLDLSKRWDSLDKNTQRYIATIAAGSRQQSRFIAMMSDYERTQELVTAANASAGASNRQFEKTTESLRDKLNKLENAWKEFTMGILNSELVKTGIEILTKLLEIINKATSSLDSWGNSLTKIIGVLAIFKLGKKLFDKFQKPIFDLFTSITNQAGKEGYLATDQWIKGSQKRIQEAKAEETGQPSEAQQNQETSPAQKPGFFGYKAFGEAAKYSKQEKKAKEILGNKFYQTAGERAGKLEEKYTFGKNGQVYQKGKGGHVLPKEEAARVKKDYKELKKQAEQYSKAETEFAQNSTKKWQAISQGIGAVGEGITGIGLGLSALGGVLSSMGLEEAGKIFSEIGQWITLIGGAISALVPIIQLISFVAQAAGISMAAAAGWVGLVVAGVIVLGAAIIGICNAIENSSPEAKLRAAQEEADKAAKAAQSATENFNALRDSIVDLQDKYAGLDKLTRGTEEWNEAVREINGTVMELIQKYPQLAGFLKAESGVLTLDVDSAGVQQIIIEAQTVSIAAENASRRAEQRVMAAKKTADIGNTSGITALANERRNEVWGHDIAAGMTIGTAGGAIAGSLIGGIPSGGVGWGAGAILGGLAGLVVGLIGGAIVGGIRGEIEANNIKGDTGLQDQIAEASKNLAKEGQAATFDNLKKAFEKVGIDPEKAEILAREYASDPEEFVKIGQDLYNYEVALKEFSQGMADYTKTLISLPKQLENNLEGQQTFWKVLDAVLDGEDYERYYQEELTKIENGETQLTQSDKDRFIAQIGGKGAKLDGDKIVSANGQVMAEGVDDDYFKSLLAEEKATKRFKKAGEATYSFLEIAKKYTPDDVASDDLIERLFSDKGGLELYEGEDKILEQIDVGKIWEQLLPEEKELFGSEQGLQDYINNAKKGVLTAFSDSLGFQGVNARAAKNLTNITKTTKMNDAQAFVDDFNTAVNSTDDSEDQQIFKQLVGAISPEQAAQREVWEETLKSLQSQGVELTPEMEKFFETALSQTQATYSTAWLQQMGVSDNLASYYQEAVDKKDTKTIERFHNTFKKWREDYNTANDEGAKAEHELIVQVADKLTENLEKQLEMQEELAEAIDTANERLVEKMQQQIDAQRQARQNEETQQEIKDRYSQLAYLQSDTSGANILEQIALQDEIAKAEQEYRDNLVDQAIQEMSDANAKAAEQRERQIEIANMQLEAYRESSQIYDEAKAILDETRHQVQTGVPIDQTSLGALYGGEVFESKWAEASFWDGLAQKMSKVIPGSNYTPSSTEGGEGEGEGTESSKGPSTREIRKGIENTMASAEYTPYPMRGYRDLNYAKTKEEYVAAAEAEGKDKGTAAIEFDDMMKEVVDTGYIVGATTAHYSNGSFYTQTEYGAMALGQYSNAKVATGVGNIMKNLKGGDPQQGDTFLYKGKMYYKDYDTTTGKYEWYEVALEKEHRLKELLYSQLRQYKTGGLADFTGPAWLDGTKSKPEIVLNQQDSANFIVLKNVLSDILHGTQSINNSTTKQTSGDNHFDIDINVEKIDSDYDVEQMADKIRRMIYNDATYRNVNVVGLM